MFHVGDLRSGIALSLSQQKLLTCFIYADDDATSTAWQSSLSSKADLIREKTVLLRFTRDSQEAQYLSTFCPINTTPTIVVMKYGAVVEKLESPLEDHQVLSRLVSVWSAGESPAAQPSQTDAAQQVESNAATRQTLPAEQPQRSAQPTENRQRPEHVQQQADTSQPEAESPTSSLQDLLPDRAARLEADQAAKQAEEKAARIARSEARRREAAEALEAYNAASGKGKQPADAREQGRDAVRADWVRQQAKRKEQAKQERERILKQIESDRQERRHKATVKSDGLPKTKQSSLSTSSSPLNDASSTSTGQTCSLQVRLLDGSSCRKPFPSSATLDRDVRAWVKDVTDKESASVPYSFRLIRPLQPSRTIEKPEEHQSLSDLALLPSASLVLVASANKQGDASFVSSITNLFTTILASILGFFNMLLGIGNSSSPPNNGADQEEAKDASRGHISTANSSGSDARTSAVKLRTNTLATARARETNDEPSEFYNGNSSAFEARKDNTDEQGT